MGTFYSVLSYLNWYGKPQQMLTKQKLQLSTRRLIYGLRLRQQKLQHQSIQAQTLFIKTIKAANATNSSLFNQRSVQVEANQLNGLIQETKRFAVIDQLVKYLERIRLQAGRITQQPCIISSDCLQAIQAIVYLYKDYELGQILDMKQLVQGQRPGRLTQEFQELVKIRQPYYYQRNIYVIQMLQRNKGAITLEKINEIGHNFLEDPQIPDNHASSTVMYNQNLDQYAQQGFEQFACSAKIEPTLYA